METLEHTISEEMAKVLREPFPNVQKVTKKWKTKDGSEKSITLDYISHAVVTDRLLKVDPGFRFEPLLDSGGIPIVVTAGLSSGDTVGVWGRLSLLGAEVVEFCSGRDLLDAYSRCLCRAAMRRGVALDLWIRDDEFKEETTTRKPTPAVPENWAQLEVAMKPYGPSAWDDWKIFGAHARDLMFLGEQGATLTQAQKDRLWETTLAAAQKLMDEFDPEKFPPPAREDIREVWAWALSDPEFPKA